MNWRSGFEGNVLCDKFRLVEPLTDRFQRTSEGEPRHRFFQIRSDKNSSAPVHYFRAAPRFMDYRYVYLPKNDFIRDESMETEAYTDLFFPFKKPTYRRDGDYVEWDVEVDRPLKALMLTCDAYTPIATRNYTVTRFCT